MQTMKEMIEASIDAMDKLIDSYNSILVRKDRKSIEKWHFSDCPLCNITREGCVLCPHLVIAGIDCLHNTKSYYGKISKIVSKYVKQDGYPEIPEELYSLIEKRIEELKEWKILYPKKIKKYNEDLKAFLWLRLGDNAGYESFSSIEEIKEIFEERNLTKDFTRHLRYGIVNTEFHRNNYISLYYGDKDAQPTIEISDSELEFLNKKSNHKVVTQVFKKREDFTKPRNRKERRHGREYE